MRELRRFRGLGLIPLLIVIALILILAPVVMWMVGVAIGLLWMAVRICAVLLVLLFLVFFLKVMARKVNS